MEITIWYKMPNGGVSILYADDSNPVILPDGAILITEAEYWAILNGMNDDAADAAERERLEKLAQAQRARDAIARLMPNSTEQERIDMVAFFCAGGTVTP